MNREQSFKKGVSKIIKIFIRAGWLPFLVFLIHRIGADVFDVYNRWPWVDIPMHFIGGVVIAFFFAVVIRELGRNGFIQQTETIIFLILVFALTCTAAVFWEFAEWTADRIFGTNYQVSLNDTIADMLIGIVGGTIFLFLYLWKQRKNE